MCDKDSLHDMEEFQKKAELNRRQFGALAAGAACSAPWAFSAGAATVPAAVGTRRNLAEIHIDTGVCVQHDTYVVDFGVDAPSIGTAKCASYIAGIFGSIAATVSPAFIPRCFSADASRRQRAYVCDQV